MNCPFYANALHQFPGANWQLVPNRGSNQCALITNAHSPCIMEVKMGAPPEWSGCPRNPENREPEAIFLRHHPVD